MTWLNRLLSLLPKESVYETQGLTRISGAALEGWTARPSAPAAPTLSGPIRLAGSARPGNLMMALLRLQDAHQDEQEEPEDNEPWRWHGRGGVQAVWLGKTMLVY